MPLTGKYLKYNNTITYEIFEKIWIKLARNGWRQFGNFKLEQSWDEFKTRGFTGQESNKTFFQYGSVDKYKGFLETTVQEILGYDPFVKEEFVLPEKWCIKIKANGIPEEVARWRKSSWSSPGYMLNSGMWDCNNAIGYTEITFEQFKKYVLKEIVPEYVELLEGFDSTRTGKIFDTKNVIPLMNNWSSSWTWESIFKNDLQKVYFKPSTKEAFDAQNRPKSIEKWSVGSYVVFLNSKIQSNGFNKGDIRQIHEYNSLSITYYSGARNTVSDKGISEQIKWFATKSEAQEFAKTLVEPVKKEVKQPLKQAVHCKTQEEWDFVLSKFNLQNLSKTTFNDYKSNSCIQISKEGWKPGCKSALSYFTKEDYQILSFQEWCDLNGYKMKKEVKFEVGQWVCNKSMPYIIGKIDQIKGELVYYRGCDEKEDVRHATPEEINNHLISIGQIPAGEPLNTGLEPNKDGMFKYTTGNSYDKDFSTSIVPGPLKMTLSIDDEELPMVNIIKTKTVNLLNLE